MSRRRTEDQDHQAATGWLRAEQGAGGRERGEGLQASGRAGVLPPHWLRALAPPELSPQLRVTWWTSAQQQACSFLAFLPSRPLWVHYPQDVTTFSIDDQFLLGERWGRRGAGGGEAALREVVCERGEEAAGPVQAAVLSSWALSDSGLFQGMHCWFTLCQTLGPTVYRSTCLAKGR